jgi:dGTPase|tara:strand:- start:5060 stop:6208 length:1149 start_codon:yes stop_codon:yes gene_type:complete
VLFDRETLQENERKTLAPYASFSADSKGRKYKEPESRSRTAFQKDRDRVIHTSAFRRLEYKTQVFVNYEGDYYRTRLTHTLEVAQVARALSRALGLNEDLAETVALAHDLGHPPFGHAGEETLDRLASSVGGFDHNKQSLRIVSKLEQRYANFPGLNLCWETLEGIIKHETAYDTADDQWQPGKQPSLEAQVVNLADELAYNAHDLDDGLRSGLLNIRQIANVPLIGILMNSLGIDNQPFSREDRYLLIRELLGLAIEDAVATTVKQIRRAGARDANDVRGEEGRLVTNSARVTKQLLELRTFLHDNLYFHYRIIRMRKKADQILSQIFEAYMTSPQMLPSATYEEIELLGLRRTITDYIAGMTDRYASEEYGKLFYPNLLT